MLQIFIFEDFKSFLTAIVETKIKIMKVPSFLHILNVKFKGNTK